MPAAEPIPDFDLYRELEVHQDATFETIEAAYRSLAKRFHPDVASSEDATRIKRLTVARQWLGDPGRRALYDAARLAGADGATRASTTSRDQRASTAGQPIWVELQRHGPGPYRYPVGRAAGGDLIVTDLKEAPHVLLTGDRWADLGEWLRACLYTLLCQATPAELKIIVVGLEWDDAEHYADVPQLLTTPVVNMRQAVNALKWTALVVDSRLAELAVAGCHDIDEYNRRRKADAPRMPRIVMVVGGVRELLDARDLDIERTLMKLALTADRVGIHLVVACSSSDISEIAGVVRAIPTRIAYRLSDPGMSEAVLGTEEASGLRSGELLYMPPATWNVELCRGLAVSDDDLDRVLNHWRAQGGPRYQPQPGEPAPTEWRRPSDE